MHRLSTASSGMKERTDRRRMGCNEKVVVKNGAGMSIVDCESGSGPQPDLNRFHTAQAASQFRNHFFATVGVNAREVGRRCLRSLFLSLPDGRQCVSFWAWQIGNDGCETCVAGTSVNASGHTCSCLNLT